MHTNDDDPDLERVEFDFSRARLVNRPRSPDGFVSTREAWPAILAAVERGMPAKCLILDWHWANGRRGRIASGRQLVLTARSGLGLDVVRDRVRTAS